MAGQDLSFESIQSMDQYKEYTILFKKKIYWKPAKVRGVVFIKDYDGFKPKRKILAYPIIKPSNPNKAFKELQQAGIATNKMLVCAGGPQPGDDGSINFQLSPAKGSMSVDFVKQHGGKLFQKLLKSNLSFGETTSTEEETTEPPEEVPNNETPSTEPTSDTSGSPQTDGKALAETIKNVVQAFGILKSDILSRVKNKQAQEEDQTFLQSLRDQIKAVLEQYQAAPKNIQQHSKIKGNIDSIQAQAPNIDKLLQLAQQALNTDTSSDTDTVGSEKIKAHQTRLKQIQQRIEEIRAAQSA